MKEVHTPVLIEELRELLNLKPGDNAIDATMDGGGHARMMLELVKPGGKVLGIDQDTAMVRRMKNTENLIAVAGNFRDMAEIAGKAAFKNIKAILFDLGMSAWHLKESGRGFSFQKPNEPLLMNLKTGGKSAAEIVNQSGEKELARVFKEFGEVPRAGNIAGKIISARRQARIRSVGDLLNALGIKDRKQLAKIFQALRIAANEELEALRQGLESGFGLLPPGGRMAVISYHSLEDRAVKQFFRSRAAIILTKKPITPSREEVFKNPSSRSAKLRVLQKI